MSKLMIASATFFSLNAFSAAAAEAPHPATVMNRAGSYEQTIAYPGYPLIVDVVMNRADQAGVAHHANGEHPAILIGRRAAKPGYDYPAQVYLPRAQLEVRTSR